MAIDKQKFIIELRPREGVSAVFPVRYVRTIGRDGGCGIAFDRAKARRMSAGVAERALQRLESRGSVLRQFEASVVLEATR